MFKNIFFSVLFCSIFCCCNTKLEESNLPPSEFEISVNSEIYNNVIISWSKSFDPENDIVEYIVFLDDKLIADKIVENQLIVKTLKVNTSYTIKIIANDTYNNETIVSNTFETSGNLAPTNFEISLAKADNVTASVNWTKSIDPEDDESIIIYEVVLNDKVLSSNVTSTYYELENLKADTEYSLEIIASDKDGFSTSSFLEFRTADGIYNDDLDLYNQNQINNFGNKGYVQINGNVTISDFSESKRNIVDLSPLSSIKIINGYFDIRLNRGLNSLEGLTINQIGRDFRIKSNSFLQSLKGLENLERISGNFEIERNTGEPIELKSLDNLKYIGGTLRIYNNFLNTIDTFNNLEKVNYIFIEANGVNKIKGFNKLSNIKETIQIERNSLLTEINGFNNLRLSNTISIYSNDSLEKLSGFNKLLQSSGNISIGLSSNLSLIDAFRNLETAKGFSINNTAISNLNMLANLVNLKEGLTIANNSKLKNLEGLNKLEGNINSLFNIFRNQNLTSLKGIEKLKLIEGNIQIISNEKLRDFCGLVNAISNHTKEKNSYSVQNNLINPTLDDLKSNKCN
jgi:hypothetical protein